MRIVSGVPADPFHFWRTLHPNPRYGFFLGSGAATDSDHRIFLSIEEPEAVFISRAGEAHPLTRLSRSFSDDKACGVPRFVGLLGFEAGRHFDLGLQRLPKLPDPLKIPESVFGDYSSVVEIDLKKKMTTLHWRRSLSSRRVDRLLKKFETHFFRAGRKTEIRISPPTKTVFHYPSEKKFGSMVRRAQDFIRCGDIYQANLSLRFEAAFHGDPISLYQKLCRKNPSPYAGLLKLGDFWIASSSPELLLSVQGRMIVTRPIAGTRPRGRTEALDRRLQGQLLLSPKERAEHVMLVDLERNDVGRVAVPGSVRVTDSYAIERYSHVMHIVSQVEGRLARGKTSVDALKAVFPGGTITGCPKIRSIDIIGQIEKISRAAFYGSVGYFCQNGDAAFNILIRTMVLKKGRLVLQAGAGIVADSRPDREYREVLAKARAMIEAAGAVIPRESR